MIRVKNYTEQEIEVDDPEIDEWTHVRYETANFMHTYYPREDVLEIKSNTIVAVDRRGIQIKESAFRDIISLLNKWKKEGQEDWASKFVQNMIEERIKSIENLLILRKMDCRFVKIVHLPIYEKQQD